MTPSSSINDLIPLGQRATPAAQKPRNDARDAGFDRALSEADRSDRKDAAQRKPVQEACPRDPQPVPERRDERISRPERAERRAADEADHVRHGEKRSGEARADNDAKTIGRTDKTDSDADNSADKTKSAETAAEAKPEVDTDKAVAENAVAAETAPVAEPAVAAPALTSEALLAALKAPVDAEGVVSEAAAADAVVTAAQTQSSQVVAQAAAPVVADGAVKTAEPTEKAMIAAQAAAPVAGLEKTAATLGGPAKATAGLEGAEGSKPAVKKLESAELSTTSQASANTAARDFAKVLDQVSNTQASNPTTGVMAASPTATALVEAAAKPATPAEAMARADAPVPLQAVAVEIGMRAMRGSKEFSIRLDPEDLGRIDVRLEVSEEGQVKAKVVVERVETLQLLQRDAKTLERAFDQAGLKTSADGLQFSLRDPGQQARDNNQQGQQGRSSSRNDACADKTAVDEIALRPAIYRMSRSSGLDIRI